MSGGAWIELSAAEVELVKEALDALRSGPSERAQRVDQFLSRLNLAGSAPAITVGVYGGVVQWVSGNPFPIRIIDYDGDESELPDTDDEGHPCSVGFEAPDPQMVVAGQANRSR
jgi:hypothetical protein